MKKIVSIAMLISIMIMPVTSFAQKIGFVMVNNIFLKYDQKNGISKKIQEQFSGQQKELEDMGVKFQALEKEIKTNSLLMTESKLQDSKKKLQEMYLEMRNKEAAFNKEVQKVQRVETGKVRKIISEIITEYGKEKGYDIILESGVVYVADSVNVSSDIWDRLDKYKK